MDHIYSFQDVTKPIINTTTRPFRARGKIILLNNCQVLQPSIIADSSISLGTHMVPGTELFYFYI